MPSKKPEKKPKPRIEPEPSTEKWSPPKRPSALGQMAALLHSSPAIEAKKTKEKIKETEVEISRHQEVKVTQFERFGQNYWSSPDLFAQECVLWPPIKTGKPGLTEYQARILAMIPTQEKVCVRGPHGLGKSCLCGLSILWFALTREALKADWKIVTTAGTNNQLKRYLWPEVRRWARLLDWEKIGRTPFSEKQELLEMSIKLQYGLAFAVSPDEPANIEGAHADHLYYCYDESKLIVPQIWDAAEGAFSGAGEDTGRLAFALAISTPGAPVGRFFEIQNHTAGYEDWEPIHVTLQEAMKAGRVTKDWVIKRRRQWGETSSIYQQKVLGNFASDDEDSVCPLTWVELANQRYADLFPEEDAKIAA